jgi:hypothetical protein
VETLVESHQNQKYCNIGNSIKGLFLFGTPHQGMKVEALDQMVDGNNKEAKYLLLQLQEGSEFMETHKDALVSIWDDYHGAIVSFYETAKTKQPVKVGYL